MGYYQGDYYAGDYYGSARGDPAWGFALSNILPWVAKGAKALFGGGKAQKLLGAGSDVMRRFAPGAAAGAVAGQVLQPNGFPSMPSISIGGGIGRRTSMQQTPTGRDINLRNILPGGKPLLTGGTCEKGWHLNKSYSYAYGMEAGTYCVKNRSMNVANGRALRRGLRRVGGFGKLASRSRSDISRAASAVGATRRRSAPCKTRRCK